MAIYVVRHGQTDWNTQKKYQGQHDIPLNATGIAQAHEAGMALRSLRFEAVWASPLSRALETARVVCGYCDFPTENIHLDARLVERGFGRLEGLTEPEAQAYLAAHNGEAGLEDPTATGRRLLAVLQQAAVGQPNGDILVASHGSAIACAISVFTGGKLTISGFDIPNGGICRFDTAGGALRLTHYAVAPGDFSPGMPEMPIRAAETSAPV